MEVDDLAADNARLLEENAAALQQLRTLASALEQQAAAAQAARAEAAAAAARRGGELAELAAENEHMHATLEEASDLLGAVEMYNLFLWLLSSVQGQQRRVSSCMTRMQGQRVMPRGNALRGRCAGSVAARACSSAAVVACARCRLLYVSAGMPASRSYGSALVPFAPPLSLVFLELRCQLATVHVRATPRLQSCPSPAPDAEHPRYPFFLSSLQARGQLAAVMAENADLAERLLQVAFEPHAESAAGGAAALLVTGLDWLGSWVPGRQAD